jgi:hypothetical protein
MRWMSLLSWRGSPVVGGVLFNWFNIRDLFWVSLVLWTVSTVIIFPLKRQPPNMVDSKLRCLNSLGPVKTHNSRLPFRVSSSPQHYFTIFSPVVSSGPASSECRSDPATRIHSGPRRRNLCNSSRPLGYDSESGINNGNDSPASRGRCPRNNSCGLSPASRPDGLSARWS